MPDAEELPKALKPYSFHGVDLSYREKNDEAIADCPFCLRMGKFYINAETGQFSCKTCGENGNVYSFLRLLWEKSDCPEALVGELATDRSLSPEGLEAWGIRWSAISNEVLIPGFDAGGKFNQLYKREYHSVEKRWFLNMPKGLNHAIHGVHLFDRKKPRVYVCEGIWDGVALWDMLRTVADNGADELIATDDVEQSLFASANVVAAPTCTTFSEYWVSLFAGKEVVFLFDNDHPDRMGRLGALEGTKHAVSVLMSADEPPDSIKYLNWGEKGFDPDLKHGFDVRDLLTSPPEDETELSADDRMSRILQFFSMVEPVSQEWLAAGKKKGQPVIEMVECERWDDLVVKWKRAMTWTEGLDRALSIMLAAAASVDIGGDQLWVQIISPPSGGKTSLCDGLVIDRKNAVLKSITKGFHSGWKAEDKEGNAKDVSLLAKIKGKAVVTKDGDTLISAINLPQILSDARDAYDRNATSDHKNGVAWTYENHSWVWILCGTPALREIDSSELGQRFLSCRMLEVDDKVEKKINSNSFDAFTRLMAAQATANGDRIDGPDKLLAKQMTGGYLHYLRREMKYLVSEVKFDPKLKDEVHSLAVMVARFRARPSTKKTSEEAVTELSTRVQTQLLKLAWCLAVVMNRPKIDAEVMRRVRQTALDSCSGKTLEIARMVHKAGKNGIDPISLGIKVSMGNAELRALMIFLKKIDVLEPFAFKGKVGLGSSKNRWRLTVETQKLYTKVMK